MANFNPLGEFVQGKSAGLGLQQQQLGLGQAQANAPRQNTLADIGVRQAQRQETGQIQQQGISQERAKLKFLNNAGKAFKQMATVESRVQAAAMLGNMAQSVGVDPSVFSAENLTDEMVDRLISTTESFARDPKAFTAAQRQRQSLNADLIGALTESGQLKPTNQLTAKQQSAAIAQGLLSKAGATTAKERIAGDPGLTQKVATSQAKIRSAIKQAETTAKARGETITDLSRAEAAMPGLTEVVGKLKVLADDATFTLVGKAFNAVAKQFGLSTKGDTSRASMVSIVDNQVLPLLRPIFGAAFTAAEGDRLRNAFLDPDSTSDSRKAQLDAFLDQMQRNIEVKKRELGGQQPEQPTAPGGAPAQKEGGQIMVDAQGNRAMVFPDGTFEEL